MWLGHVGLLTGAYPTTEEKQMSKFMTAGEVQDEGAFILP